MIEQTDIIEAPVQEQPTIGGPGKPILAADHKKNLGEIILKMKKDKQSEDVIKGVVGRYMEKFSQPETPQKPKFDLTFTDIGKINAQQPYIEPANKIQESVSFVEERPAIDSKVKVPTAPKSTEIIAQQPIGETVAQDLTSFMNTQGVKTTKQIHQEEVDKAHETLLKTWNGIDEAAKNVIVDDKIKNNTNLSNLIGSESTGVQLELPPLLKAREERKMRDSISQEEIDALKANPQKQLSLIDKKTKLLKSQGKEEEANNIQASVYALSSQRRVTSTNDKKIVDNIEAIKKGELQYDAERDALIKPEGFWDSIGTGYKERSKAYDGGYALAGMDKEEGIKFLNKELNKIDPDKPIPIPSSALGETIGSEGIMMAKGVGAGALAGMFTANPFVAGAAATAATSDEAAMRSYYNEFVRSYAQIKNELKSSNQGMSEAEIDGIAYDKAADVAKKSAYMDAAGNAVMNLTGARLGAKPLNLKFSPNVLKTVKELSGGVIKFAKQGAPEGLLNAAITGGLQAGKNIAATEAGVKRDTMEGVAEAAKGMLEFHYVFGGLMKATGAAKKLLLQSLAGKPIEITQKVASDMVEDGVITPQEAEQGLQDVMAYKQLDAQIPETVADPNTRIKIQDKIAEHEQLNQKIKGGEGGEGKVADALAKPLKEQVKNIEEDIEILQAPPEQQIKILTQKQKELQSALDEDKIARAEGKEAKILNRDEVKGRLKEITNDLKEVTEKVNDPIYKAAEIIKEGKIKGFTREIFEDAVNDPEQLKTYLKDVADQAQSSESERATTIDVYGQKLVDIATEMFPKKEPSRVSVIRPEEMPNNEIITIKPTEDALQEFNPSSEISSLREGGENLPESSTGVRPSDQREIPTETFSTEKGNVASEEGKVVGITHERMNELANKYGVPEYDTDPERMSEWREQATKRINSDPEAIPKLINKLRNGDQPDKIETTMMLEYIASLDSRLQSTPTPELLAEFNRAKNLINIAGREWGKAGRARQQLKISEDTLPEYLAQEAAARGEETLSQPVIDELKTKYDKAQEDKAAFEAGEAKLIEEAQQKIVSQIENAKSSKIKKTKEQFTKERNAIISKMRADLLKAAKGGGGLAATVPGLPQLQAVAPHVTKLIKSYIEEGITKFDDIVTKMKGELDPIVSGITDDQVKGLIYGEYKTTPIKVKLDPISQQHQDNYIAFLKETNERRALEEQKRWSKTEKTLNTLDQILGLRRLVQTAIDVSIPFRQGITIMANPRQWDIGGKAISEMANTMFSQKKYDRMMYNMKRSPLYKEMEKKGVYFTDADAIDNIKREEDNRTNFLLQIPYIREPFLATNRAASAFSNVARFERYAKLKRILDKAGFNEESDPKVYEDAAKWVNNLTGRGNMLSFLESPDGQRWMGRIFYGARLMASRFNLLNPLYYAKMPKPLLKEAWKDMGAFTGTMIATGLALKAAGAEVDLDPDSADFLKAKWKNTRYDLTGGIGTYLRLYARLIKWGALRANTKNDPKEDAKYARTMQHAFPQFFRYKLSPNTSYGLDFMEGKDALGNEFDPKEALKFYPMYTEDVIDAWKNDGVISLATVFTPSLLGVGVNTYEDKEKRGGSGGGSGATGAIDRPKRATRTTRQERSSRD